MHPAFSGFPGARTIGAWLVPAATAAPALLALLVAAQQPAPPPGAGPESRAASRPAERPNKSEKSTVLKVGDAAPDFRLLDHTGKERSLEQMKGKRFVLWFYPKADTKGCTMEGCGFRDRNADFLKLGVEILGISFDTPKDNAAFVKKFEFPYALLCDTDKKVSIAYGAAADEKAAWPNRITYVIGADGKIEKVYEKVDVKIHANEILEQLGGAKAPK